MKNLPTNMGILASRDVCVTDAIKGLREEGKSMSDLMEDTDIVGDKIVELKPEIKKG